MQEDIASRKLMSAQLVAMDAPSDQGLFVAMFVESFGDASMSWFGAAIFVSLTKYDFTSESVIARPLQDSWLCLSSVLGAGRCHGLALQVPCRRLRMTLLEGP